MAKDFLKETGANIQEKVVGNLYVKYDNSNGRTLISNLKDREIRTFYKNDGRSKTPFEDAVKMAEDLTK